MVRVKRGNVARKRRKKILSLASGYRGAHSVLFRVANQQVMKALRYSYIGRKQKKRIFPKSTKKKQRRHREGKPAKEAGVGDQQNPHFQPKPMKNKNKLEITPPSTIEISPYF